MAEDKKDNVVFIGAKPFMIYMTSVAMQFTTKEQKEVVIKARGRSISMADDVAGCGFNFGPMKSTPGTGMLRST